ncbi:ataxin-1 and HBP1 module (AXH) domain-containing protein [Phthorimaea operculella]|nr:ataxin-1 and HBP1 module (AXH) domain-containing protein [Phthorimaea operculella]
MISASLPSEALAQLGQLGQLSHLYPPPPAAGMTPEFLAPPPRPYARYPPRRREVPMSAPPTPHSSTASVPSPLTPAFPPVPGAYAPYLHHPSYASYLYRARQPQPPIQLLFTFDQTTNHHTYASYLYRTRTPQNPSPFPLRPRPTSGFVPPAPHSPPISTPAPAPPTRESPPTSPERGAPAPYFCRGALIRLEDGSFRRVEEMRTEDFVMSADRSGDLTLTQCTLLRLEERGDRIALTLTYDRNRSQVELESTVDHPFFVYGRGWASVKPERTMTRYGLRVQRLQTHPENLSVKEDARKRRWSASDLSEDAPPLKKR